MGLKYWISQRFQLCRDSFCDMILLGSGALKYSKKGAVPMSTMEVLTLGILLVNVIGLVFTLSKK